METVVEYSSQVQWHFRKLGGREQALLRTADELCALSTLDPKLWSALSCPVEGLEFDPVTLSLLDTDEDGRVRIPEVLAAVDWLCARLHDPAVLLAPLPAMPLAVINTEAAAGKRLHAAAKAVLEHLGREEREEISEEDADAAIAEAAKLLFNGDGVLPPHPEYGEEVRQFITDALAVCGGMPDAGGLAGINRETGAAFVQLLHAWTERETRLATVPMPLDAAAVPEAWRLIQALGPKLDDYFLRCELAAYIPEASAAVPEEHAAFPENELGIIDPAFLESLPVAGPAPEKPLRLSDGLNPLQRPHLQRLLDLLAPMLATAGTLTATEWAAVQTRFAAYAEAAAPLPSPSADGVPLLPTATPDSLGAERIREILESNVLERFEELAAKDADAPAAAGHVADVRKAVHYYRHLHRLLRNFVSFEDFYTLRGNAVFQAGTLYIDGKSCRLCVPVTEADKHAGLAAMSGLFLLYCRCRRRDADDAAEATMQIAAAVTAGDTLLLAEARNGVFIDNKGRDWDAEVIKVVRNPVNLRQAALEPYRRFARMVNEQIAKFAGSRDDALTASAGQQLDAAAVAPPKPPFDIGKSVGIFAAVGLALGAIGTALAALAGALLSLQWWQIPLVFVAVFLFISGPSMLLAWLKLRSRSLCPLLEASGWAINNRAPVNGVLGKALTATAVLPPNIVHDKRDPTRTPSRLPYLVAAVAAMAAGVAVWLYLKGPGAPALLERVFGNGTMPM